VKCKMCKGEGAHMHEMDGANFCCRCFQLMFDYCANIKSIGQCFSHPSLRLGVLTKNPNGRWTRESLRPQGPQGRTCFRVHYEK
jgi:hypothetical protein